MTTALAVTGTPGKVGSFSAKTAAPVTGQQYTQLSVMATPGRVVAFVAKAPSTPAVTSQVTTLNVFATPGSLHSFTAKTAAAALPAKFNRMSTRDIQYEALTRVVTPSDARTMEYSYWQSLFGGTGSTLDIMHEGIIIGLGNSTLKDYYDTQTATTWPDHNSSEREYWLKILTENF